LRGSSLLVRVSTAAVFGVLAYCQAEAASTGARRAACEAATERERHGLGCWRLRMRQAADPAPAADRAPPAAGSRRAPIGRDWERARLRENAPRESGRD
jgi:hypothetical protein